MIIHGMQKLTLVDYPGKTAAILFTGACNFRCPFCQNGSLVLNPDSEPVIPEEEIFSYLKKRRRVLDGVVITGGEPTMSRDLIPYMKKIKDETGLLIKLDTNGYMPDVLISAVESGYVDYVAMDIKNSLDMYPKTAGIKAFDPERIKRSIEYLLSDRVDYEFRTTVVHGLHSKENFEKIGPLLKGAKRYFLQTFVDSENTIEKGHSAPSDEEMKVYLEIVRNYIGNIQLRDK